MGERMKAYKFDANTQRILENSVVPIGVYQLVDDRVVVLDVSVGLCQLFGYANRAEAVEKMNRDLYWNVHPDDAKRVEEAVARFALKDEPFNLVVRARTGEGDRLIHIRGKYIVTPTGERLAVMWYIDEGTVALDAKAAASEVRIGELKASMQSLLNNMPALTFSKNVEDGRYLACNQMFADYAHRKTPEDVVGLTDHEIFDARTADHFVSDDRIALSMDAPFSFFEDVPDAAGNPRRFQTTKLKFIDETGRLCLLGMSTDVTETMQTQKESVQSKADYQDAMSASAVYESILGALSKDYFNLYYVDTETGEYVEYGFRTERGERTIEKRGADFFAETRENARSFIYEEDLERFMAAVDKEKLLAEIRRHGSYIYHYRLMLDGVPTYVSMKATRVDGDSRHIIIGVSNVDTQVKDRMAAERAAEEEKLYLRLSALNGNLIVLYFIDPRSGQYTEYSSSKDYKRLGIAKQGEDFFQTAYENSLWTVHPEDQALFHAQVTKENVLEAVRSSGVFVMDYRLMSGDLPTYVQLKAAMVEENGKEMLIVGLLNQDVQIRQEQEYARKLSVARKMAVVDPLTGVKNKHAYMQWEEKINEKIRSGEQGPFAVVVCDINNLKTVNDLLGHQEGDACIKKSCARICGIYNHSPVFRIGGDEFVIILSGEDYARRASLLEQVSYLPKDCSKIRIGETISAGMAEYKKSQHSSMLSVFEEADKAMYERKQYLKDAVLTEDRPQEIEPEPEDEEFPVINMRKRILIADDLEMNREMLGDLLKKDYDIIYASDGVETLDVLRRRKDEIDLVLLDLYMPNMNGRDVISEMQVDEELMSIPVIFLTIDEKAELDCLKIGAMDFIPKPYPDIEIVKARIDKCIELSEDRDLIRHTEHDKLTGLLNREFFFRYVNRLDQIYKETALDAVVCDVNRFHATNKQYGRQFGNQVLRAIGAEVRKLARQIGGIGCRESGDTFLLYCPHQDNYDQLLRDFQSDVFADAEMAERISLRFGIFTDARQTEDVEERFTCAKTAADQVKDDPRKIYRFFSFDNPPA